MATPSEPAPQPPTPQPPTPQPSTPQPARLSLRVLLHRSEIHARGQRVGRLADVIVRLAVAGYPRVTGAVADLGRRRVFIPAHAVRTWQPGRIDLIDARVDVRPFERRPGEVLLRTDALADLPQERRLPVLGRLPANHRLAITQLLGYPTTTAGGLRCRRRLPTWDRCTLPRH